MAGQSGIIITGLDELLKNLDTLEDALKTGIDAEMSASADKIQGDAKQAAPIDENRLAGSISIIKKPFNYEITVGAKYAPFQEFGTGKKVQVPSGYEAYAMGFKKAMDNGTWLNFVKSIEGWMKRHGITAATLIRQVKTGKRKGQYTKVGGKAQAAANHQLAIIIARKILKDGLKPQPFLFPAFLAESKLLLERVKKMVEP